MGSGNTRIAHPAFARKICSAEDAAAMIYHGDNVGMSGFTGSGYPKAVPATLAARIAESAAADRPMRVGVWTGASTAPELDGALAAVDGIELRLPYQSDPVSRAKINSGRMEYIDIHLSHVAQMVWEGFLGHLDVALVEVSGITPDGELIPSSSVGNNKTWLDLADRVILEVNSWQSELLEGMHDIYYGTALPPNRLPVAITAPGDRIGVPYLHCPAEKVVAVVEPTRQTATTRSSPGRDLATDRRAYLGLPIRGGRRGPDPRDAVAVAVRRRQCPQRGAGRPPGRPIRPSHRLHRGDPGRHAGADRLGQAGRGVGHRVLAEPGDGPTVQRARR